MDQIIPVKYLTLVPSNPKKYAKLGSLALPLSRYAIIIAGANFRCGSSREHALAALGASGVKAVVAESYARIFFRNSVATGEIYPLESAEGRVCNERRGTNHTTGKEYKLKPIRDAGQVIEAGGIFAYARKTGMIVATVV
ncbi:hypothetical protein AMTRI_Chr02g220140 [Amborella trichopoda]